MNNKWISTRWTLKNSEKTGKEKDDWIRDLYFTNKQMSKLNGMILV